MDDEVAIYLAKAKESLTTAESEFINARYNSCANRCYYACFQAAVAALMRESIRPRGDWGHDFVQGQFVGLLIDRRKRYDSSLRSILSENQTLRNQADYEPKNVSRNQASRALERTRRFVTAVQRPKGGNR